MKAAVVSLIVVLFSFSILAQQEGYNLWFKTIHALPNFSPSFNYWVYHDSQGFVWISSSAGLNRYDGNNVVRYSAVSGDSTSLRDDNIQSPFFEDRRNDIWFSTGSAIHRYRRSSDDFNQYLIEIEGCESVEDYRVFFIEKDSFLWFSSEHGVAYFDIHDIETPAILVDTFQAFWYTVDTALDGSVKSIYGKGKLNNKYFSYCSLEDRSSIVHYPYFDTINFNPKPSRVNSIYTDNEITWVGTDIGLIKWDRKLKRSDLIGGNTYPNCYVAPWGDDRFILWSMDTLYIFEKNNSSFHPVDIQNLDNLEINPSSFFDIYVDNEENLWIPFFTSGLIHANLNKTKFKSFPKITVPGEKQSNYSYWSLLEGEEDIWYGTSTAGLFRMRKNGFLNNHFLPVPDNRHSLPYRWVTRLAKGQHHRIWVGTQQGLAYVNTIDNKVTRITGDNLDSVYVSDLIQLEGGNILVTTNGRGILHIDENKRDPVIRSVLDRVDSYSAVFEYKNRIFISRNSEEIEVFQLKDTLVLIDSIALEGFISGYWKEPDSDVLWIGSFTGLTKVRIGDQVLIDTVYTEKDGLPSNNIHAIQGDTEGNLWLSTPMGLVKFLIRDQEFITFSKADGTRSTEFHLRASVELADKQLLFGGANGLTLIPPTGSLDRIKVPPNPKIINIKINDEARDDMICDSTRVTNVSQIRHLVVPFEENTITIEFTALEYSDPSNNRLWYQLENVDDDWVKLDKGDPGLARYPNIWIGRYKFIVQAFNSDGEPSGAINLLTITVKPPWYLTWWALIFYVASVSYLIYAYYRFRINQIRKKEEMLRKEAEFRQKEAELKQQMAETETAILRLQMNPHFIFNSMNSINSYILKKDIDTASDYLGRFSKLMRMILNLAANPFITVYEEAELLELYMMTEAMRFEEKFTYQVDIDASLDPDDIILPTMILQPFVENAIKHGLSGTTGPGRVWVQFRLEKESLICTIEDNGIGRTAAAANAGQKGHVSKAMDITTRRLALLETETGLSSGYQIDDLYNETGEASGTRVVLTLPVLE